MYFIIAHRVLLCPTYLDSENCLVLVCSGGCWGASPSAI